MLSKSCAFLGTSGGTEGSMILLESCVKLVHVMCLQPQQDLQTIRVTPERSVGLLYGVRFPHLNEVL